MELRTVSKNPSKATIVSSLFQLKRTTSKFKFNPKNEFFEEFSPYPSGEWKTPERRNVESTQELDKGKRTKTTVSDKKDEGGQDNDEEEGEETEEHGCKRVRVLRGPTWNYGLRKISADVDYYNHVLFGVPWAFQKTPDDMIFRGAPWFNAKPITSSMAVFVWKKMKKIGYNKTALVEVETGRSLSYGELADKAESLACGLHWLGVQPNQIMAVVSYHSLEAHLMLLACLLVGAVTALVDSSLNAVDLGVVLRTTSPNYLFSEPGSTLEKVEDAMNYLEISLHSNKPYLIINSKNMPPSVNYLLFSELLRQVNPEEPTPGPRKADPLRPVLILYSGTVDNLRACVISERYFTHSRAFVTSVLPNTDEPSITVMVTPPMYIALAIKAVFNHYIDGHRIVLCRGVIPEPSLIVALRKYDVFAILTLRTTLISLLDWTARPRCPVLKLVAVTGVPLRLKNLQQVHQEVFNNKVQILQLYGLVETGTTAANTFLENKHGSVGKLFYNVALKVLEEGSGLPLGFNVEGELCVKSPTMMLGYYNNPEANKDIIDEEGFVHTGDLGFYDEEGFLHVTGRIREMIKWRTYLVNPLMVEEVLMELPEVKEALVFGLFDEEDKELVSAAVILESEYENIDLSIIEQKANDLLPDRRKIRGGIYAFSQFPRLSMGKPNRDSIVKEVNERRIISQRRTSSL